MKFQSVEEALEAIDDDAARRAWEYLQSEIPNTADAIIHLVNYAKWSTASVLRYVEERYGETETKTQHKMKLLVESLVRERDK